VSWQGRHCFLIILHFSVVFFGCFERNWLKKFIEKSMVGEASMQRMLVASALPRGERWGACEAGGAKPPKNPPLQQSLRSLAQRGFASLDSPLLPPRARELGTLR